MTVTRVPTGGTTSGALADGSVTDAKVAVGAAINADKIADGSTNHVFTAADDTKLTGVATGATANSSDATLLARANHTGTQAISTVTGLQTALDNLAVVAISAQTGSYTLVLADASKAVEVNAAGATNVTIPPNSSVAFPIGAIVEVMQLGAGQVTLVAGSGVTLRSANGLKLRAQYSSVSLRKRATDEWAISGDATT